MQPSRSPSSAGDASAEASPATDIPEHHDLVDAWDPETIRRASRVLEVQARYHRTEVRGLERVPAGPALLVGNHSGGATPVDGMFLSAYYRQIGCADPIAVLAHATFFKTRVSSRLLAKLGVVEARPDVADRVLSRRRKLLVFPGTDFDALRPFRDRKRAILAGHRGFARIAVRRKVPVVPIVNAGGHEGFAVLTQGIAIAKYLRLPAFLRWHSFPVVACLPWGIAVGPFAYLPYWPLPSKITVEVQEPIDPASFAWLPTEEARVNALYEATQASLQEGLTRLYAQRKWPIIG